MQRMTPHIAAAALLLVGCDSPEPSTITLEVQPKANIPFGGFPLHEELPAFEPSPAPALGGVEVIADQVTMRLARHWAQALEKDQPQIDITVSKTGNGASAHWWEGGFGIGIALLGDALAPAELAAFLHAYGFAPRHLRTAMDPVVVVVHPDNPLAERGLTLQELRDLFGRTHTAAGLRRWGDLGNEADFWRTRPIEPYEPGPGLSEPLRRTLLRGDFGPQVMHLKSGGAVVDAVIRNPAGIGIAMGASVGDEVKVVPVAEAIGAPFIHPDPATAASGDYPLPIGFYHLYIAHPPNIALDAPRRELVRFIYSREGQQIAAEDGLVPLSAPLVEEELDRQGISLSPEDVRLASVSPRGSRSRRAVTAAVADATSRSYAPEWR